MTESDLQTMQAALDGDADAEIVASEARLRLAQLAADVSALDALIDDALLFAGPDGHLATKADDLEAHRSGRVRFRAHRPHALQLRRVGAHTAIASLLATLEIDVNGDPVRGQFRYTRVWAREGGGSWRVVGGHVSPLLP